MRRAAYYAAALALGLLAGIALSQVEVTHDIVYVLPGSALTGAQELPVVGRGVLELILGQGLWAESQGSVLTDALTLPVCTRGVAYVGFPQHMNLTVEILDRLGNPLNGTPFYLNDTAHYVRWGKWYGLYNWTHYVFVSEPDLSLVDPLVVKFPEEWQGYDFHNVNGSPTPEVIIDLVPNGSAALHAEYRVPTQFANVTAEIRGGKLCLTGYLLDVYGAGVPGRTVKAVVNGEEYTATTGSDGSFSIDPPGENATVTLVFEGDDVYVGTQETVQAPTIPGAPEEEGAPPAPPPTVEWPPEWGLPPGAPPAEWLPILLLLILLLVLLLLLLAAVLVRRGGGIEIGGGRGGRGAVIEIGG